MTGHSKHLQNPRAAAEHIYHLWGEAHEAGDVEALLELYAPEAVLESPLVPKLLGKDDGICRGRAELAAYFQRSVERRPPERRYHRTFFFTDGERLFFEYPRRTPEGDQIDLAMVMELKGGLIQHHRIYVGWYGVGILERDEYR